MEKIVKQEKLGVYETPLLTVYYVQIGTRLLDPSTPAPPIYEEDLGWD